MPGIITGKAGEVGMQNVHWGIRLFVGVMYGLIGLSFLTTTGVLIWEFGEAWFPLASFYSHLFVFFPTFGLLALLAFYTPSYVFLDLYWNKLAYGKARFLGGLAVIALLSWWLAGIFTAGQERSIWEVSPSVLAADQGEPAGCDSATGVCDRLPIMTALRNVRSVSQSRIGLSDLTRRCEHDPLVEEAPTAGLKRFCFVSTALRQGAPLQTDAECCRRQVLFANTVKTMHDSSGGSVTSAVHRLLLPLKVFFLLILAAISVLLAVRSKYLDAHYEQLMPNVERGVLIGALAMLFFPIMNHAFLQSAQLLYGDVQGSAYRWFAPWLSFVFGAWAVLIFLFFFRQRDKELEQFARIGSIFLSAVAILKYDLIIDYFVRVAGSGASLLNLALIVIAGTAVLGGLYLAIWRQPGSPLTVSSIVDNLSRPVRQAIDDVKGKAAGTPGNREST